MESGAGSTAPGGRPPETPAVNGGRVQQKRRTHDAIVAAARDLIRTGGEVNMPAVARRALVSEATAYRYFPDLASLLREALAGVWPDPAEVMRAVEVSADPVERIAHATEVLLRHVLAYQGAVRAAIAATITSSELAASRPGYRFGLIDSALRTVDQGWAQSSAAAQLRRDLAVVMSAEALFTLTDLCGLDPEAAISSAVRTARTLTAAALADSR
jgi:AcrR family transcriptional regulator